MVGFHVVFGRVVSCMNVRVVSPCRVWARGQRDECGARDRRGDGVQGHEPAEALRAHHGEWGEQGGEV